MKIQQVDSKTRTIQLGTLHPGDIFTLAGGGTVLWMLTSVLENSLKNPNLLEMHDCTIITDENDTEARIRRLCVTLATGEASLFPLGAGIHRASGYFQREKE